MTLLVLVAMRFAWAMLNVAPAAPAGTPAWQIGAARFTHAGLYGLTFATALLGWLLAGASEPPIEPQAFGLVPIPTPVSAGRASQDFLEEAHELTAYALVGRRARGGSALPSLCIGRFRVAPNDLWRSTA
jgi:cytochrome b561